MKVKFVLAELGTASDTKDMDFEMAARKLTSDPSTAFDPNGRGGPRAGFILSKFSESSQCLMLRYLYPGAPFTKSVLLLDGGDVRRIPLGTDGGVVLRQGFVLYWPSLRFAAAVQMPAVETDMAFSLLAGGLFQYARGQGFLLVLLSDDALAAFRKLGGGHDVEIEVGGSTRIRVEDIDSGTFNRSLGQLALVEDGEDPVPLEEAKDRFVAVGTNLRTTKLDSEDADGTRMIHLRQRGFKQRGKVTEFVLQGGLPDLEDLDNLGSMPRVADSIRGTIDYLFDQKYLGRALMTRPDLTRIKVKPLEAFGKDVQIRSSQPRDRIGN